MIVGKVTQFQPGSLEELRGRLCATNTAGEPLGPFDLARLDRVLEHCPEDMTVTVQSGICLARLQALLRARGQWLPIDPPEPEVLTIERVLSDNLTGPRRYGYGTIRDYMIGIGVMLADGRLIKSGGKVVKNVAGYDLGKLFIGARGTLGVIVEGTFKLRPLPEAEGFLQACCSNLEEAGHFIEAVAESELDPVVFDLHDGFGGREGNARVVLGFAGAREDVEAQLNIAGQMGFSELADLEYHAAFWREARSTTARRLSVLPSTLIERLRGLGATGVVARAGNGEAWYLEGADAPREAAGPHWLMERVKETFDRRGILPKLAPP